IARRGGAVDCVFEVLFESSSHPGNQGTDNATPAAADTFKNRLRENLGVSRITEPPSGKTFPFTRTPLDEPLFHRTARRRFARRYRPHDQDRCARKTAASAMGRGTLPELCQVTSHQHLLSLWCSKRRSIRACRRCWVVTPQICVAGLQPPRDNM